MSYTNPQPTVIALKVIPKPAERTRSILQLEPGVKGSVIINVTKEGNPGLKRINYICGQCGVLLVVGAAPEQLKNLVLRCNQCDSYNDLP